ncbi:MAG: glycosyl transferase family 8 [Pseudarthrobacter sp.]|nr:glycosyl transferase family 8 [Pseudarthrobacter sp.]
MRKERLQLNPAPETGNSANDGQPSAAREQLEARLATVSAQLDSVRAQRDALRRRAEKLAEQRDEVRSDLARVREKAAGVRRALDKSREREALLQAQKVALRERSAADGTLVRSLERGIDFDHSAIATVRELLSSSLHVRARSFSQALLDHSGTENAGHVGVALVAAHQDLDDLAFHHFTAVPDSFRMAHAPNEWISLQFAMNPDEAFGLVMQRMDSLSLDHGFLMATVRYAYREKRRDLGQRLLAVLKSISATSGGQLVLNERDLTDYDWLVAWEEQAKEPSQGSRSMIPGGINIGVLDYKQPDFLRQSGNLGDYVQTLGSLGHLLSFGNAQFAGDSALVETAAYLQPRLRPDLACDTRVSAGVNLVRVDRDASHYNAIPENTWLIAFGWYMHSTFRGGYDFPFNENINPIFVSFHIQHRKMLTPEAIDYLKAHGPIGCRDWTTTYLLLSVGVDAFFSGCLTTTVDAFFPDHPEAQTTASAVPQTAVVDTPVPAALVGQPGVEKITQVGDDVCRAGIAENIVSAVRLLEHYRSYQRIITSRLHCYLPATALGCNVEFTPRRLADVRFDGLLGMEPGNSRLRSIQDGLRSKLRSVYASILSGASRDDVYQGWRSLVADEVAAAKEKLARPAVESTPGFDEVAACQAVAAAAVLRNGGAVDAKPDVVNIALAADQNLRQEVPVVIESIVSNTNRPVHFWFLTRGHDQSDYDYLAETFPQAGFTFLPCDTIDYGEIAGMLKHITVSTMDRLLLPLLLENVDRVIYHDIDAVTCTDIGELYDHDLQGHPLGARSARASWAESGFSNVYRAANRLDHPAAFELRRRMHNVLSYDFLAFNAGIMLLDLRRMRADNFCRRYIPFAAEFGMNDQEILNCYAGPERLLLDPAWNAVAQQEVVVDPKIIHWAGPAKPWTPGYVIHQDHWNRYVNQLSARGGSRVPAKETVPVP